MIQEWGLIQEGGEKNRGEHRFKRGVRRTAANTAVDH